MWAAGIRQEATGNCRRLGRPKLSPHPAGAVYWAPVERGARNGLSSRSTDQVKRRIVGRISVALHSTRNPPSLTKNSATCPLIRQPHEEFGNISLAARCAGACAASRRITRSPLRFAQRHPLIRPTHRLLRTVYASSLVSRSPNPLPFISRMSKSRSNRPARTSRWYVECGQSPVRCTKPCLTGL